MTSSSERDRLIRELFPIVKKIAHRVARLVPGSDRDDLVGDGCVGLIRAVDSFDPARGPSLENYAARIIAGAMLNGIRRLDPVSERVRRELREADRERFALASERGEMPSQREMESRRPALRRATMHAHRYAPLSLDGPLPEREHLSPDAGADPATIADAREELDRMQSAILALPPRQRRLIALHYYAERSLHDVGRRFEVSPQRASQLHLAALRTLRKSYGVGAR